MMLKLMQANSVAYLCKEIKMSRKLLTSALLAAGLLTTGAAQAALINVGGVVWDPNSVFDFSSHDSMVETITNTVGQSISGYAKITTVNGNSESVFCPGCELTYTFSGFTLQSTAGKYVWSGGTINVFVDNTPNFDATKISTAVDGALWLSLSGRTFTDGTYVGTLISDPTPAAYGVAGGGTGELDVVGGLAKDNFDTDTIPDGFGGMADFLFTSSFQLIRSGCIISDDAKVYCLQGSNDLAGDSVPEPGSLALAGLGLLGLAGMRRRKQQA